MLLGCYFQVSNSLYYMMLDSYVSEILLLFFILMTINFSLTKHILCIFLKEMDANVCQKTYI